MIAVIWPIRDFIRRWFSSRKYIPIACKEDLLWKEFDDIIINYWHLVRHSDRDVYDFYRNLYLDCKTRLKKNKEPLSSISTTNA